MSIFNFFRKKKKVNTDHTIQKARLISMIGDLTTSLSTVAEEERVKIKEKIETLKKNLEALRLEENPEISTKSKEKTEEEETEEKITKVYAPNMTKRFIKFLGIDISPEELPFFVIDVTHGTSYSQGQIIGINSRDINSPSIWGEEIGHYLRKKINNLDEEEVHSSEFFGYLGRRIASRIMGEEEYQPNEKEEKLLDRKEVLDNIKHNKEQLAMADKYAVKEFLETGKFSQLNPVVSRVINNRKEVLEHSRPYHFASKLDLSKITNWKKLFSMPDHEVRRRFFRPDPDYSGL